ncbi:MAG: DUF1156 domain-containing protein [Planctomycetes bacterium]|nr:DUF1156 domain-containing protein [Planctomycetota bacterium]
MTTLLEADFPFEAVSEIAEVESWRKEIYRPIYHLHKWWAQRLGSVFRAAILGAAVPAGSSLMDLFYDSQPLSHLVVFDPFMGSGTTVGEAHKLGCAAIGRDINPVAFRAVRAALQRASQAAVLDGFNQLEQSVGASLRGLYRSTDSAGEPCDVMYFFWVKVLPCPSCSSTVDLFSSQVFARHAYVALNPIVRVLCPGCGAVFGIENGVLQTTCNECDARFAVHEGPARRTTAICRGCGHEFPIAATARKAGKPPAHRMYAKLVLRADGTKEYLRITNEDREFWEEAKRTLGALKPCLPHVPIATGFNTRQILNYGYGFWDELFNERQLLALSILARGIQELSAGPPSVPMMVRHLPGLNLV